MITAHVIDRPGLVIYYQGQDQLNQELHSVVPRSGNDLGNTYMIAFQNE